MINEGMFTSNSTEWATPRAFFDELDAEFAFTLDPCATAENAKCARYFTKDEDGLAQSWKGERVFCNPPYGRTIGEWVKKAHDEVAGGGADFGCLAYSRPDGHGVLPRLHIPKTRNSVYTRAVALQREQGGRTFPLYARYYAIKRKGG